MDEYELVNDRMELTIASFEQALTQIRTSGANPNLVSNIEIDYYGMMTLSNYSVQSR